MTREQQEKLVGRLEALARSEPKRYRRQVALLAALGYGFAYLLLALILGIIALIGWILLGPGVSSGIGVFVLIALAVPLLGIGNVLFSAMQIRLQRPRGMRLDRRRAGALFAAIDSLAAALKSSRVHEILLTTELNACLAQTPRLGLFGWYRNTLQIGLPLLAALSPLQFGSIIAHELGHLSGQHGKLGAWVYRVRATWLRIFIAFESRQTLGRGLLKKFVVWYVQRFDSYSVVLRRQHEYDADALAARIVGNTHTAEALMHIRIAEAFLDEHFWPEVLKLAGESAQPPPGVFSILCRQLPKAVAAPQASMWLRRAMLKETDLLDSHPCLVDRLGALGHLAQTQSTMEVAWKTAPPPIPATTAVDHYFAASAGSIVSQLEETWRTDVDSAWRKEFAQMQGARRRLQSLFKKAQYGDLTDAEAIDRCVLTRRLHGSPAAIEMTRNLVGQYPEHAELRFFFGDLLLDANSAEGIEHLKKAMSLDVMKTYPACERIYVFLNANRQEERAAKYLKRAEQHYAAARGAQRERDGLNESDQFEPHQLSGDLLVYLRERLAEIKEIDRAFLVRKSVKHFPEKPMYVLALGLRDSLSTRLARQAVFNSLASKIRSFPQYVLVTLFENCPGRTASEIQMTPNSQIHPRLRMSR